MTLRAHPEDKLASRDISKAGLAVPSDPRAWNASTARKRAIAQVWSSAFRRQGAPNGNGHWKLGRSLKEGSASPPKGGTPYFCKWRAGDSAPYRGNQGGFTLAEALAALMFMAIVIPVAVQGLRIANLAGQVAQRKAVAARIAERIINESIVTAQSGTLGQRGMIHEGVIDYQWTARTEPWTEGTFKLLTVQVSYPVQGQNYDVSLSALMPLAQ